MHLAMKTSRTTGLALLLLGGCSSKLMPLSQNGQYRIDTGLRAVPFEMTSGLPLGLEGSHACLWVNNVENSELPTFLRGGTPCFTFDALHPVERDEEGCFILDAEESVFTEFYPNGDCRQTEGLSSDTFLMSAARRDEVEGRVVPRLDVFGRALLEAADGGPLPGDISPAPDEPILVIEGGVAYIDLLLFRDGIPVAYDDERFPILLEAAAGSFEFDENPELGPAVTLSPGAVIEAALGPSEQPLAAGALHSVPLSDAASLEIIDAYPEDRTGVILRAVVRDDRGAPLYGAPIDWSAVGTPIVLPGDGDPHFDYTTVADVCSPPPDAPAERSATITASLGALTDTVEVTWVAEPAPDATAFEPDPACPAPEVDELGERGCACRQGGTAGIGGLMTLALLLLPRRRRSS